jgi:MFS family permease
MMLHIHSAQSFAFTTRLHHFPHERQRRTTRALQNLVDSPFKGQRASSLLFRSFAIPKPIESKRKPQTKSDSTITKQHNTTQHASFLGFPNEVAWPLALLLLSQFILFIGVGAVIPSIPLYGKVLGLSNKLNGIVISAPAVASLLASKAAGRFADRARKPAMSIGMAVIIASDVGTALANSLLALTLARFGLGLGRIVSESGERGLLADLARGAPELRGRALAAQQAVVALGIAIGAPAGGVVVEQYGPRASFFCVSAAACVAFVLYQWLPETVLRVERTNEDTSSDEEDKWTSLLQENKWKGLALCQIGASSGFAAKIASIPILAADALPGGAIGAGALLSAAGLAGLIGAPIGGWLTDQTSAKSTAILSGVVSATGLLLIPFALQSSTIITLLFGDDASSVSMLGQDMSSSAAAFTIVVLLWSIGAAAQGPALTAFAQELAPAGIEATAMALPRACGDGTYIVAPFLLGFVSDLKTSVAGTDCAAAGVMGLLGVLALVLLGGNDDERDKQATMSD